jgi:hypothetical protein
MTQALNGNDKKRKGEQLPVPGLPDYSRKIYQIETK